MENNSYHPESENHTHTHDTSIQVTKEIQHPYILHTLNTHPKVTKINILGSYLVKGKKKLMRVQKAYVQGGVLLMNRRPEAVGYFKAGTPPIKRRSEFHPVNLYQWHEMRTIG